MGSSLLYPMGSLAKIPSLRPRLAFFRTWQSTTPLLTSLSLKSNVNMPTEAVEMKARWTSVDEYIVDRLVPTDSALDCVLSANAAADLPPHDVSPNQGKLLHIFARMINARRVLEIGTI
jgi:hypothetical protein